MLNKHASFLPSEVNEVESGFHAKLLDGLFDGVYFVNQDRKITYWNRGAENLTGYSAEEAIGRHCFDNLLEHVDANGCALCKDGCPLWQTLKDGKRRKIDVFLRHKQGHRVPICVKVAPIKNQAGEIVGAVEVFSDVTMRKQAERRVQELEQLAFKDSLTSLPNRRYTELRVKQILEEFREFNRVYGVLMVDIDRFKMVNDAYGHDIGDIVLRAVSDTLEGTLRSEDDLVGRWGGEEFLVLSSDMTPTLVDKLAERCRFLVEKSSALIGNERCSVTVSIGATVTRLGDSFASIVKRVDTLMYASKANGRNRTTVG